MSDETTYPVQLVMTPEGGIAEEKFANILVEDPTKYNPSTLLRVIESDPEAFTAGRRNNDLVNWFLAERLFEIESNKPRQTLSGYLSDFDAAPLSKMQRHYLRGWGDSTPSLKIQSLYSYYCTLDNPFSLRDLWIPITYRMPVI